MTRQFGRIGLVLVLILSVGRTSWAQAPAADIDAKAVNLAIDRAVGFLVSMQDKESRVWQDHHGQPGGLTALCTLAILNSGVPASDERVRPALDYLCARGKPTMVYASSLTIMHAALSSLNCGLNSKPSDEKNSFDF